MRATVFATLALAMITCSSVAEKAIIQSPRPLPRDSCDLVQVAYDWDFETGAHDFYVVDCDQGGVQVWEYGATDSIPDAPRQVWGTVLNGDYPEGSGSGLASPSFLVTGATCWVEVYHYYETEAGYDGGNVSIGIWPDSQRIEPVDGYSGSISSDPDRFAFCVDEEMGWTGSSERWRVDCFDLTPFLGQQVALEFDFGSDASGSAPGWYLARVAVGSPAPAVAVCCITLTGECRLVTQAACNEIAWGDWHPEFTTCDPNPCGPPPSPSNLVVETMGPDRMLLTWEDRSALEDGFLVERKESLQGEWLLVAELGSNVTSWEDGDVLIGRSYYYRVRARGAGIDSPSSNYAKGTAGIPPAAPTTVVANAVNSHAISITWDDQADNELGFLVQRQDYDVGPWKNLTFVPPTNCEFCYSLGLEPSTGYTFRVRAYNAYGHSAWVYSNHCLTPADPGDFDATIYVKRGTLPINGATIEIDEGSGFHSLGQTNSSGWLFATGLGLGDELRARWVGDTWETCRGYRDDEPHGDMGMVLTLDSDVMNTDGSYSSFVINNTTGPFTLQLAHPIFWFDLGIGFGWDLAPNAAEWAGLRTACQNASNYLYDVSDGQMALRRIAAWDNKALWDDVDVQIESGTGARAHTGQFMDCDDYSENEHVFMYPVNGTWHNVFVHELGHYIMDLKDEYETPGGGQAEMDALKQQYPDRYPRNFGVMDSNNPHDEMSSRNDYLQNYFYDCYVPWVCKHVENEHLFTYGKSCWDFLEEKFEDRSSYADIKIPPAGWFKNGVSGSADRTGPSDAIGLSSYYSENNVNRAYPPIDFRAFDSGRGGFDTRIVVQDAGRPAPDARIYRMSQGRMQYLGRTDQGGIARGLGLRPGDEIRAYHRSSAGVTRERLPDVRPSKAGGELDLSVQPPVPRSATQGDGVDTTAPGVCADVQPVGSLDAPGLTLDLWPDEPLGEMPVLVCFYGAVIESLQVGFSPEEQRYFAEILFPPEEPLFDGTGVFETFLADTAGNASVFTTPFRLHEVQTGDAFELFHGPADLNILAENIHTNQTASGASSHAVAFRVADLQIFQVSDLFSLHLAEDDALSTAGGLNVSYDDSLLTGLDETSLRLYRWERQERRWSPLDSSLVSVGSNVVSAPAHEGGVFCLFAERESWDSVPPGPIEEFGAVGVEGGGAVELLWTATGDDGTSGAAQDYTVAYADSVFTEAEWADLPKVVVGREVAPAGTECTARLNLPREGQLYYLAMRGKDEASNLSPLSNLTYVVSGVADQNYVSAPPTNIRAVDAPQDLGNRVSVSWERSLDDGAGKNTVQAYRLYRNRPPSLLPEPLAIVPAGTTSYVDEAAELQVEHLYWVAAADSVQETVGLENRAFSARNLGVPPGDFTSDEIVGVNDLSLFLESYGTDSTDVEFEPLFDLSHNGIVYDGDFDILETHFGFGGAPGTDPPGENLHARVFRQTVQGEEQRFHLNLTVRGASNLSGYSARIQYPHEILHFVEAVGDSAGAIENMLNRDGGVTPVFLVRATPDLPGVLYIANAIQRPSSTITPEGDGFLVQVTFEGSGIEEVVVSDIVLMDHRRLLNYLPAATGIEDGTTILRPYLYWSAPNPCVGSTMLRYQIPGRQRVELKIYDPGGRLVRTLVDGFAEPGVHTILWDGRSNRRQSVAAGVYFLRFETTGYSKARKVVLVR